MVGFKDNQDVLDSAVRMGLACPNCYSTAHSLLDEDGNRKCLDCYQESDSDDAQKDK